MGDGYIMMMFNSESVRLLQKAPLPDGRMIVWVEYDEVDDTTGEVKTHRDTRTCKPTKKGIVTVSLFGDKYKFNTDKVKTM